MNSIMRRIRLAALVISAGVFLTAPFAGAAEPFDPAKDLEYDIRILEAIIMSDLSGFTLPTIKVLPEDEFDAYMAKVGVPEQQLGGYQPCEIEPDVVLISSVYATEAPKLKQPMDTYKYFRLIRFHELYHWANCKISGMNRFWGSREAWSKEERYATIIESRFLIEQLGETSASLEEYQLPPKPDAIPENSLPEEEFRNQPWKLVNEDMGLIPWKTASGPPIFIHIAESMVGKKTPYVPDYDAYSQHLPLIPDFYSTMYYQTIMHRGRYIGFEMFEIRGDSIAFGMLHGLWEKKYSWWDKGYIPNEKGFVPDNPIYTGEWVRIGAESAKESTK
jgi:hypothetical protein